MSFRVMSEMYAVISQDGKEIFKVEKGMEIGSSMKTLITNIRDMQGRTNLFLTGLIENVGDEETDENDDAEESDDENNEPESKLPRRQ